MEVILLEFFQLMIPIGICVIMPVLIVWLVLRAKNKDVDKKMNVLMRAIENGVDVDPNLLVAAAGAPKTPKSIRMRLLTRMQVGVIFGFTGLAALVVYLCGVASEWALYAGLACLAVGTGFLAAYLVGRKYLASEIEAEDRKAADNAVEQNSREE